MTFTHALSTNNYGPAKFIVSANAYEGTHTTIAAALTSASSGDTIFIRPGTYTENLTLKAGVNLAAYGASLPFFATSSTVPNVIISGKATFTGTGTVGISAISLQTNSDFALAVTGSSASVVILNNCFINCTNNTGVSFTSSSASSTVQFNYCSGDIGTTGIALFSHSATGNMRMLYSLFANTGNSTTNNTVSGTGGLFPNYSGLSNGTTFSSSSTMVGNCNNFTMVGNQTAITTSGTASVNLQNTEITGGTSSAISIGTGSSVLLQTCQISSSNATTIAGTGTLSFTNITFNSGASLAAGLTLSNASTNTFISGAGVGTSGQVLTSNGVTSPPTWQTPGASVVVQQIRSSTAATDSTSTAIPADDTIPQNTEGKELLTVTITPTSSSHILVIQAELNFSIAVTPQAAMALFQDSTANALCAGPLLFSVAGYMGSNVLTYYMTAGTTSSTTFKLRYGPAAGGTVYINSVSGTRLYGGVALCSLIVTEYTA